MSPAAKIEQQAASYGFRQAQITSNSFLLTIFINNTLCHHNTLHVYLAGDGQPWWRHRQVAIDPTPSHLLAFDLMRVDNASTVYLGRPCYHGQYQAEACHPLYWTHWRYSATVVNSMASGLIQLLSAYPACRITLIGYSGGGTLAMLIAPKLAAVERVVTIAGNLDVTAWADYHDYSALDGSLNPATEPALPATIAQIHLIGNEDNNIPAEISLSALKRQSDPVILRFPNADHDCCWVDIWPTVLNCFEVGCGPN